MVFSQFVDHLAVVRERVDERGMPSRYVDGSTSMKQQAAFQQGEGDMLLIGLRAGGPG